MKRNYLIRVESKLGPLEIKGALTGMDMHEGKPFMLYFDHVASNSVLTELLKLDFKKYPTIVFMILPKHYQVQLSGGKTFLSSSLPELLPVSSEPSWGSLESQLFLGGARKRKKTYKTSLTYDHRCCMCGDAVDLDDRLNALIPKQCLNKYGTLAAHRICKDCWFEPETGFAVEGANHQCPGCAKNMPLNKKPRSPVDPKAPVEEIE